jgi:hypothetical protein
MNPASHFSSQVHHVTGVLCVGLAAFLGVQCVEREAIQCEGAYRGSPSLDEPKATDYAHAVPAASPKNWTGKSSTGKGSSVKTTGYDGAWYRCALPLSTACFLLSFGIWSLQSQPNHAIRPRDDTEMPEVSDA